MTGFTDFTGASYECSATRFTSQLQLCGFHSMFVPSLSWYFCGPVADVCRFEICVRSTMPGVPVSVVWVCIVCIRPRSSCYCAFAAILRSSLCYCWYCAHTSIVGIYCRDPPQIVGLVRRRRPSDVAPATSGVLVQVCIVLHRFAVFHGFQCQCNCCILVVFLCARAVTPQIRNGNA
jgi:hypothetical protein